MFENIIETSIFVRILIIAFLVVLAVNIVVALLNLVLTIYIKSKRLT